MQSQTLIDVRGLSKWYGKFQALDEVFFKVRKGDIFGFLGPNGAGKTTTIKILTSALTPEKGSATLCGFDLLKNPLEIKDRLGLLPESPGFYEEMSCLEALEFFAEFHRIPRTERKKRAKDLLDMLELGNFSNWKIKNLSKGMKQKLCFAAAVIHDPELLILDEPTQGLDPNAAHQLRNIILKLNREGKTIFLSSHLLWEVEEICNVIGIIHHGKMKVVDTIEHLRSKSMASKKRRVIATVEGIKQDSFEKIKQIPGIDGVEYSEPDNKVVALVEHSEKAIASTICEVLVKDGCQVQSLNIETPSLEAIYLSYTGGS
jgi:ABC-2 type transport system ATP-binding protein